MEKFYCKRMLRCAMLLMVSVLVGCKEGYGDRNHRGLFSVSATCQVEFATGNLSENGRSFVEHQWESGGLFGWGTGSNPTHATTNSADYISYVEWGSNPILNGTGGAWRTLTNDEYVYLFHDRANAAALFGLGSVDGVNGVILLPDDWTTPAGLTFTASTTKGLEWNGTYYFNEKAKSYKEVQ